jgi:hypothetical protein
MIGFIYKPSNCRYAHTYKILNYSIILNCHSIEEFIPLLKERMNVLNPYVRQFLVGWITVLDSVPDIDMLGFLPDFLDGNNLELYTCKNLLHFNSI